MTAVHIRSNFLNMLEGLANSHVLLVTEWKIICALYLFTMHPLSESDVCLLWEAGSLSLDMLFGIVMYSVFNTVPLFPLENDREFQIQNT